MIVIEKDTFEELKGLAEEAYPNECCGILLGKRDGARRIAVHVLHMENMALPPDQRMHFRITAQDILKAEETASDLGLEIVGFFHSHPDCRAFASQEDDQYALPKFSYPILSVIHGKFAEMNSFTKTKIHEKLFLEEHTEKEESNNGDYGTNIRNIAHFCGTKFPHRIGR